MVKQVNDQGNYLNGEVGVVGLGLTLGYWLFFMLDSMFNVGFLLIMVYRVVWVKTTSKSDTLLTRKCRIWWIWSNIVKQANFSDFMVYLRVRT